MLYKFTATLALLSALSNYYASAAVVSLAFPEGDPALPYTGNFLGTDSEGHTSWSIGLLPAFTSTASRKIVDGTIVVGPTDVHEVAATTFSTDGTLVSATVSAGCALATGTNADGSVHGDCSAYAQVNAGTDVAGAVTVAATVTASVLPLVAVQVPDSGPGALPTGLAAPRPTSAKNGAVKGSLGGASGWGVVGAAGLLLAGFL